jgi:hypothetical protein
LRAEPTTAAAKRPAARLARRSWSEGGRVFAPKALWLGCSSVEDPPGIWASQALPYSFPKNCCALPRKAVSFVAPRHRAFGAKTEPLLFSKHALKTRISSEADFPGTCTQRFIGVLSITSLRLEAVLNDHIKYYGSSFIMESSLVQKYFNVSKGIIQTYRAGSNFSLLVWLFKKSIFLEPVFISPNHD